jgi:competence protein ComEC
MEQIHRLPFLRLLLPLAAGIVLQYYCNAYPFSAAILFSGAFAMLFSYFIPVSKQFSYRWVFGLGLFSFLLAAGIVSTRMRQEVSAFSFQDIHQSYQGVITDIPQEKANTFAYKLLLQEQNKTIVCYLPKSLNSRRLTVGDAIRFFAKIEPFASLGNPDEFDYARYMYNKGYAGQAFVPAGKWEFAGKQGGGIFAAATKYRQKILHFYETLGLSNDEYAMLSALTLGYKDALSDNLAQSFKTTGTAHVLAISGMHIAIVYIIVQALFGFIPGYSRYNTVKQVASILLLWMYIFIIGFPPSAVRACIMLSLLSIAGIRKDRHLPLNSLLASAFLMLVWNPFLLFDLGFQLSFTAVLSMLLVVPVFSRLTFAKNKCFRYFGGLLVASLAAQIGTFPLCLYYFGTFPSYFFVTNLLITPLIGLLMYNAFLVLLLGGIGLSHLPVYSYRILASITTSVAHFFEDLPLAQLQNMKISFACLFLTWGLIASLIYFGKTKQPKPLIAALLCLLAIIVSADYELISSRNTLKVYNSPASAHICYYAGYAKTELNNLSNDKLLSLNGKRYLILAQSSTPLQLSGQKIDVDYIHIVGGEGLSLYSLSRQYNIGKIILDGSLPKKRLKRFVLECEKLRIPYYDVSKHGNLRIFF